MAKIEKGHKMKSQSTNKMIFLIITAFIIPALTGCESIRYFKSELTGTAKPPLSESENRSDTSSGESSTEAPVSKTYGSCSSLQVN
jgi:hypothetical protein